MKSSRHINVTFIFRLMPIKILYKPTYVNFTVRSMESLSEAETLIKDTIKLYKYYLIFYLIKK